MVEQKQGGRLADVNRLRRRCEFAAAAKALAVEAVEGADPFDVEIAAGRLGFDQDDFAEALARFDRAAVLDPDREEAAAWRVAALSRLFRFAEATSVAVCALERFPGSAPIGVALGRLSDDRRHPVDALAEFDRVLAEYPDDENALEWRMEALRKLHRYADAEAASQAALAKLPDCPGILDSLGMVYRDQGRYGEALACYERILRAAPDNLLALRGRISILRRASRYEEAEKAAAEAASRLPLAAGIHVSWSYLDEACGRYANALDRAEQALRLQPSCHDALEQRIDVLRELRQYAAAEAASEEARSAHPRSPGIIESQAWTYEAQGRYAEALDIFGQALEIDDRHVGALAGRATALRRLCRYADAESAVAEAAERISHECRLHVEWGIIFDAQDRYTDALERFEHALAIDSFDSWAMTWRITELRILERYADAEEVARAALAQLPAPSVWVAYGIVLADQDRGEEALAAFEHALELDPPYSWAHQWLVTMLRQLQRYGEAEATAHRAINCLPGDASVHRQLGRVYADQDLDELALAEFRRASEVDPGDSSGPAIVARALRWLNRHGEAERVIQGALQEWPADPELKTELGWIFMDQYRYDEAFDQFTSAQENDPADLRIIPRISALRQSGRFGEALTLARDAMVRRPDLPGLCTALADVYADEGRHSEAEATLREAMQRLPSSSELTESLIKLYRWLGRCEEALAECDRILADQPRSVTALGLRAALLEDLSRYAEATRAVLAAQAIRPEDMGLIVRFGWLSYSLGRYDEALNEFDKAASAGHGRWACYGQAAALCRLSRHGEAIALLREEIRKRPNYAATYIKMCECYEDQGRYDDALGAAERAVQTDPFDESTRVTLIGMQRRLQRLDDAEASARLALKLMPRVDDLVVELGLICDDRNDYIKALAHFDHALELTPFFNRALVAKSSTLRSLRHFAEAERLMTAAIGRYPAHESLRVELGWIYRDQGRFAEAHRVFARLREEATSPSGTAEGCTGLGWVAFTDEDYQNAEQYFRDACEADASSYDSRLGLAWALVRQDEPACWTEADQLCLQVLERRPRSHLAHTCLGVVYDRRGEYAVAEYYLKRTIELDPYDGSYVDLGALYAQLSRFSEAEEMLGKALERDWYDTQAHIEYGNMCLQKDLDQAQAGASARQAAQHFRQALSLTPASGPAAIGLALALARSPGDLPAAERVLRNSIRQAKEGPAQAQLVLALARLLIERGDATQERGLYGEAEATAQQAIELAAASAEPYFVAGVATYKASESSTEIRARPFHRRRAVRYLRECVHREPGHAEARRILLIAEESVTAARGGVTGSIVLITVATALLATLWVGFFLSHRITSVVLASLTPILVGLVALGFVLPFLIRLKLPGGVEADLSASLYQISSGPTGDLSIGPGRFGGWSGDAVRMPPFTSGPRGELPRME